jgi:hypothetical protein
LQYSKRGDPPRALLISAVGDTGVVPAGSYGPAETEAPRHKVSSVVAVIRTNAFATVSPL